jgi:4-hydroxy-tetrahydrodipicolinate reductase
VLLQCQEVYLCWVIRKSKVLQDRSVPEFLGIKQDAPGLIYSKDEWTPEQLFDKHHVDVIIYFSSADALLSYGEEAAKRGITL